MTQRSIYAGDNPTILIKATGSVTVKGHESERVAAETTGRWGLSIERRSEAQIARARAAIGEHVLFDWRLKKPELTEKKQPLDVIEVQLGSSGEVWVPFGSNLKIYAGKDIDVQSIEGLVDAYSGFALNLQAVQRAGHVSAGGPMSLDCKSIQGEDVEIKAGRDLRFFIHDLTSARLRVRDLGGYWEARIGAGEKSVYLKSRGDVILVTDQVVEPLPPNYILGKIEKPPSA
jgi:hypothetical protein